jgi:hypothetical protein
MTFGSEIAVFRAINAMTMRVYTSKKLVQRKLRSGTAML